MYEILWPSELRLLFAFRRTTVMLTQTVSLCAQVLLQGFLVWPL